MGDIPGPLVLLVVGIAAFVGLLVYLSERQKKAQAAFFAQLGDLGAVGEGAGRVLRAGAHEVRTDYFAGSKNSPSRFSLITAAAAEGGFAVEREGSADRFLEGLGLEGKIATNDPDFDSRFHVVSDDEGFAASYFAAAAKRQAIVALFGLGAARVELGPDGLKASWSPFGFGAGQSAAFVRDALPLLAALAENLPHGAPLRPAPALDRRLFSGLCAAAMIGGFLAIAFLPRAAAARGYRPLDAPAALFAALRYGGAAFAVYLAAIAAFLRGRSWFLKGLVQALVAGLVLFAAGGYSCVVWLNCALDASASAPHACPVIGKYAARGKNGTSYYAVVGSWRPGRRAEALPIGGAFYAALQPGRTLAVVETKPGYLGLEWVTRLGFGAAPPPAAPPAP